MWCMVQCQCALMWYGVACGGVVLVAKKKTWRRFNIWRQVYGGVVVLVMVCREGWSIGGG